MKIKYYTLRKPRKSFNFETLALLLSVINQNVYNIYFIALLFFDQNI